jgi:tRNA pseudouridine38-40 synthase
MPRFALLISYDGSGFAGWWRQKDRRSVAGEFDAAFRRLGESHAAPVGASRTDAGVHARGQVAHVDCQRAWSVPVMLGALAGHLPGDCACRAVAPVDDTWHAVHAATGKTYTYVIDHGSIADPFLARFAWRPPFHLDLATLNSLAALVPGRRDWTAFSRRGDHRDETVRTLDRVAWHADQNRLICTVSGDGFTYRLVRSLVGAMVACAHGTCSRRDLERALTGTRTPASAQQAPAHGLCLEEVRYDQGLRWGI